MRCNNAMHRRQGHSAERAGRGRCCVACSRRRTSMDPVASGGVRCHEEQAGRVGFLDALQRQPSRRLGRSPGGSICQPTDTQRRVGSLLHRRHGCFYIRISRTYLHHLFETARPSSSCKSRRTAAASSLPLDLLRAAHFTLELGCQSVILGLGACLP